MAEVTMNTTIIQKHGLASAWTRVNPVLEKGQMGVETDTNKFKFGDGTTAWNDLPYAGIAEKLEFCGKSAILALSVPVLTEILDFIGELAS